VSEKGIGWPGRWRREERDCEGEEGTDLCGRFCLGCAPGGFRMLLQAICAHEVAAQLRVDVSDVQISDPATESRKKAGGRETALLGM
jgi:hypothetical protein